LFAWHVSYIEEPVSRDFRSSLFNGILSNTQTHIKFVDYIQYKVQQIGTRNLSRSHKVNRWKMLSTVNNRCIDFTTWICKQFIIKPNKTKFRKLVVKCFKMILWF
jgi:hypothetical protein